MAFYCLVSWGILNVLSSSCLVFNIFSFFSSVLAFHHKWKQSWKCSTLLQKLDWQQLSGLVTWSTQELTVSAVFFKHESAKHLFPWSLPVVMTTPARTFRRAWGEVKLSVSSLNLSTTRRETASARTWNHVRTDTDTQQEDTHTHARTQPHKHEPVSDMSAYKARLILSSPRAPCTCHSVRIQLQTRVRALRRQQVKLGWPPEVYLTVFQARLFEFGVTVIIHRVPPDSESQKAKTKQVNVSNRWEQSVCRLFEFVET